MTSLFIDANGNYPRHIGDLLLEHPEWDFSQGLPEGWVAVKETAAPVKQGYFRVKEIAPQIIGDEYVQSWEIVEQSEEEKTAYDAHLQRKPD
jgi:hypothetical protein